MEDYSLGESDDFSLGESDIYSFGESFNKEITSNTKNQNIDKIDIEKFYKDFVSAFVKSKYQDNEYEDFIFQGKIKAKSIYDFFGLKPFQKPTDSEKEKIIEICNKLSSEAEVYTRTDVDKRNILVNCIGLLKSFFTTGKNTIINERLQELSWNSLDLTIDEKCEDGIVSMSEIISLLKAGVKLGLVYDSESKKVFFIELKNKIDERDAKIEPFEEAFKNWFEEYAANNPDAYSTTLKNQLIIARTYKELEVLTGKEIKTSDKEYVIHFEENLAKLGIKLGEGKEEIKQEKKEEIEPEQTEDIIVDSDVNEDMILIEGGTFRMGNENETMDEQPVHSVTQSSFYMCKHEVTQSEYLSIMESDPSIFNSDPAPGEDQSNRPVEYVSWFDAIYYCNKKSIAEGLTPCYSIQGNTDPKNWYYVPNEGGELIDTVNCDFNADGYRLPTEAEWEFAARGGNNTESYNYIGSDDINSVSWYNENSNEKTHEVMKKKPNELGLYDMGGNVSEWCWDEFGNYNSKSVKNPHGTSWGSCRVLRGGNWHSNYVTASYRRNDYPKNRFGYNGFRVVRSHLS